MLFVAFVVVADVMLRHFFLAPIGGVEEHAGYALAIISTWGLADAFIRRSHIRIDVAYRLMPAVIRATLDMAALLALLLLSTYLGWLALNVWRLSFEFNTKSAPPLFFPMSVIQGLWVLGIAAFLLVMLIVGIAAGLALARRNLAAAQQLISPPAAKEEIEEEISSIRHRQAGGS